MNIFNIFGKEFTATKLYIFIMSTASGIFSGISIALANEFIEDFTLDKINFLYPTLFFINILLFILTKLIALRAARTLVENNIANIRTTIANRIRQGEFIKIEKLNQADIIVKITTDAKKISISVEHFINACQAIITIFFCIIYIGWLCYSVMILIIILLIIGFWVTRYQNNHTYNPALHELTDNETEFFTSLNHILDGFKEVKINYNKNYDLFYNNIIPLIKKVENQSIYVDSKLAEATTFQEGLFYFLLLCFLFLFAGTNDTVLFQVAAAILFLSQFFPVIIDAIPFILKAHVAMERLYRLNEELENFVPSNDFIYQKEMEYIKSFQEIRLENALFNYRDKDGDIVFSTGPINLSIKAGEIIFITGGNGSGKSTLIKMLTGLYPIFSGFIEVNGKVIDSKNYKCLFATVFTNFHLFDALYGIEKIDEEKVTALLKLFKIEHKTKLEGHRFNNINLSTGQKKRLALVIAIIEDKPIYVLDEWAADQDPYFKKYFYEVLLKQLKNTGKTIIAVTHDERYFYAADKIIEMNNGKIQNCKINYITSHLEHQEQI